MDNTPIFDQLTEAPKLPPVMSVPVTELPHTLVIANTTTDEVARELEVAGLCLRANNASDNYDGHHGDDRTEDSIDHALANNPALAKKLQERIESVEGK